MKYLMNAPVIRLRFAPSPTGYLHVGNVRTALINWLFARCHGAEFILRLDDTDRERSRPEFEEAIREDMTWLGLHWDREERQCDRMERYRLAVERLIAAKRLYPCYETPEELEIRRKMQSGRGLPPIYDRAALKLTAEEKQRFEQEGRRPHWRFLLHDKEIIWRDLIRGEVKFSGAHVSDPVLVREDGIPLYTLSSVVDDGEMEVSHIVRGEDHVSNSAVQIQIFEALEYPVPTFAHMALLTTKEGKLSKREGGGDIRSLREKGVLPLAINSYLGTIGTSGRVELAESLEALAQRFAFEVMGRAAAHYDEAELMRLNAKLIHEMPYARVCRHLPEGTEIDEPFWMAVRGNLTSLGELGEWWALVHEPLTPVIEDVAYTEAAAEMVPEVWDRGAWERFITVLKEKTGRKGKELFIPLRLALTARTDGPELATVFFLLGREKVMQRLRGHTA